MKSRRAQV